MNVHYDGFADVTQEKISIIVYVFSESIKRSMINPKKASFASLLENIQPR